MKYLVEACMAAGIAACALAESSFTVSDPFIWRDDAAKCYRLYQLSHATDPVGAGVMMRTSTNLVDWSEMTQVLHVPESYNCSAVWAPEMHVYKGAYYIFGTICTKLYPTNCVRPMAKAGWKPKGNYLRKRLSTYIFKADRPEGPFKVWSDGPIPPRDWATLDGTFFEEDGKPYMVFCHEWTQMRNGTMDAVELTPDLSRAAGKPATLFRASDLWKEDASGFPTRTYVTDGPFLYRSKTGELFMLWSSARKGYLQIASRSASGKLRGPWTDHTVIYENDSGHGMVFRTFEGTLAIALHSPNHPGIHKRLRIYELEDCGNALRVGRQIGGDFSPRPSLSAPYEVTGPDAPKPHEQTALKELSDYLGKRVAGTLRVGGKEGIVFRVGDTALAQREGLLSTQLPSEKWVVRSFGNEVLLNGGGPRGALFAVYHFLEDCCGVRWWSEFEEDVPPAGALDLPPLDLQGQPAFAYRDIYRADQGSKSARFERRVRMNAHGGADLGGAYCFGPPNFCHTFDWYLNADKYMKDHPEWFSLRKGHRVGGQRSGQLCLTNPEVKDEVLKRLLANIEKGMERAKKNGVEPPRIYDMSHNDNQSYCECDRCKAAAEKYGLSGVNLNFVNALAAEVAKKYPDVLLCTWAYQYTQPVPKGGVRAADNVIVRLCDTGSNQASSIAEPDNRAYYDCVMAWSKATKHLFVWDYAITFSKGLTGLPFPSEFHYGDLFRHYRAYNVSGIFWEHEHPYKADMWELKFFLETKLMENPDLDCNALIERFMREYYGPAGGHVLAYRRYLDKIRREKNAFISWFPQLSAFKYISDDDAATCNKMLDAAEASVAGDAKLLARVRRARLGLDRLMCLRSRSVMFHVPGGVGVEEKKVPGLDAAKARLRDDWPKWIAAYPKAKDLVKKELELFAGIITPQREAFPVPEQFRDRSYYDFPAQYLTGHGKNETLVDDPESPVGRAMRTAADKSHYFKLPFSGGVYDTKTKKSLGSGGFKEVAGDGYRWYCLGKAKFSDNCYLWLTRAWTTQLRAGNFSDLSGKELELWVSVKFTGPMFRPGTSGDSFIWIDRVLLVVPAR